MIECTLHNNFSLLKISLKKTGLWYFDSSFNKEKRYIISEHKLVYILYIILYIQGESGGKCQTPGMYSTLVYD